MSFYGWWNWSRKNDDKYLLKITRFSKDDFGITIILFLITVVITYTVYILSSVVIKIPNYIDIFTSGIFFTAMWLMANKKLESWVLWVIGDIVTVPLYAYRGLGMLSLQYIIFTFLAIQGYIEWKKSLSK
jgi:nicotinamide mononucleotide transporter